MYQVVDPRPTGKRPALLPNKLAQQHRAVLGRALLLRINNPSARVPPSRASASLHNLQVKVLHRHPRDLQPLGSSDASPVHPTPKRSSPGPSSAVLLHPLLPPTLTHQQKMASCHLRRTATTVPSAAAKSHLCPQASSPSATSTTLPSPLSVLTQTAPKAHFPTQHLAPSRLPAPGAPPREHRLDRPPPPDRDRPPPSRTSHHHLPTLHWAARH